MEKLPRENVYVCQGCGQPTVTVDVDKGVTPFMLLCRATPGCKEFAYSSFYPQGPRPSHIPDPAWEWYKPDGEDFEKLSPEMKDHVRNGGLNIRSRTNKEPVYHEAI